MNSSVGIKQSKADKTLARILDGAMACYTEHGVSDTSLEEVARTAAISRTTLYRYIDNREDLIYKVLERDGRQQVEEILVLQRSHDDFSQGLIDTIIYVMRGRRTRPINALLFDSNNPSGMSGFNLSPASFYGMSEELMAALVKQTNAEQQLRDGVTLTMVSRWVARLVLSLISYPEEFLQDEDALREFLQNFLVPSLVKDPG